MKKILLFIAMIGIFAGLDAKNKGDGKNQLVNNTGSAISVKFDTSGDFVGLNSNDRIDIPNNCACVTLTKDSTKNNSDCYPIYNDRSAGIYLNGNNFYIVEDHYDLAGPYVNVCNYCSVNNQGILKCMYCEGRKNASLDLKRHVGTISVRNNYGSLQFGDY